MVGKRCGLVVLACEMLRIDCSSLQIVCENTAPHLAGHTASIVGDFMLVFGGSMGSSYNNNVYVLDILQVQHDSSAHNSSLITRDFF